MPSFEPHTTMPCRREYAGEACTSAAVVPSHFFLPVSISSATIAPRLFQSPNSSPTKTSPKSTAAAGDEPTQSASMNRQRSSPVAASSAYTLPSYAPKKSIPRASAGDENIYLPRDPKPTLYFQAALPVPCSTAHIVPSSAPKYTFSSSST